MRCIIFEHICECKSEKADCDLLRSNLDIYTMIDLPAQGETGAVPTDWNAKKDSCNDK